MKRPTGWEKLNKIGAEIIYHCNTFREMKELLKFLESEKIKWVNGYLTTTHDLREGQHNALRLVNVKDEGVRVYRGSLATYTTQREFRHIEIIPFEMEEIFEKEITWRKFRRSDAVVECKTKDDAKSFLEYAHGKGVKWAGGESLLDSLNWDAYKERTVYSCERNTSGSYIMYYADLQWAVSENKKILTFNMEDIKMQEENEEIGFCSECGHSLDENGESELEGVCMECVVICEECGETVLEYSATYVGNDDYVCAECFSEKYTTCDDCGGIMLISESHNVYNRRNREVEVCTNCYESNYITCESCGETYHEYNVTYSDDACGYYCESCYEEIDSSCAIHDYSYKPDPIFYGTGNLFMGVELEMDIPSSLSSSHSCDNESVFNVLNDRNEFYAKHDGSLNNGFELVTHPCTLEYHMSGIWTDTLKNAVREGFRGHQVSTSGLHVHVNRTAFDGDLAIAKAIIFIEKNYREVYKLSRRASVDYCRRYFDDSEITKDSQDMMQKFNGKRQERYKNVNLLNRNTVEFRIFRSTLKENTFYATLQFVEAIVKIANKYSLDDILEKDFLDYEEIADSSKKELCRYLIERGLVVPETEIEEPSES